MAEVSRRFIDSGIHWLTAFRTTPNRLLCTEGSPGSLLNCASCHSPTKEENVQVLSQNRAGLVSEKLYRLKEAQNPQKNVTFLGAASFHLPSSRLICCTDTIERPQACRTGLPISTGFLQKKLPTSSRSKGFVFIHSDTFRSSQQLRTFCTALFVLTSTGSEKLGGELRLPHTLRGSTATRGYSSRSKTTYYDVLNVSPSATQSQIKTAYYKQSFIYHPDRNAGSQEATQRFSEISQAYTVLRNVNKRRKYDQGILNQFNAGRQSTKETTSRFTGYQRQQKARYFYQPDGRPIYDFDAYYQAHYGEQLRRERAMRARKKQMEEMQERSHGRKQQRTMELTFMLVVTMAGLIFISLSQSWNGINRTGGITAQNLVPAAQHEDWLMMIWAWFCSQNLSVFKRFAYFLLDNIRFMSWIYGCNKVCCFSFYIFETNSSVGVNVGAVQVSIDHFLMYFKVWTPLFWKANLNVRFIGFVWSY